MSIRQMFQDNGDLFELAPQRRADDITRYLVKNTQTGVVYPHSSIYVQPNDREIHITESLLENCRFPNNSRLHAFLRSNARMASQGRHVLDERHIPAMIRILRA